MSNPDLSISARDHLTYGFLNVTGPIVGGHAILVRAVSIKRQAVLLHNSWGPGWGANGTAWLRFADLDRLLAEDGECCVPTRRARGEDGRD